MQMRKLKIHRSGSVAHIATAAVCFLLCGGIESGANLRLSDPYLLQLRSHAARYRPGADPLLLNGLAEHFAELLELLSGT